MKYEFLIILYLSVLSTQKFLAEFFKTNDSLSSPLGSNLWDNSQSFESQIVISDTSFITQMTVN